MTCVVVSMVEVEFVDVLKEVLFLPMFCVISYFSGFVMAKAVCTFMGFLIAEL